MKFLADENFPRPALRALREAGFDVGWISEESPGAPDEDVLALAGNQGRTLLTFDKDFGELAFRRGLPAVCGIVLFRVVPRSPEDSAVVAVAALRATDVWAGRFSVVTKDRIRSTPLPGGA
jgi:predicted nuclease of predicted toxin-antitoxin system